MMFSDAHNHLHDPRLGDPEPIIAEMRAAGIDRCVVNSTCEEDWPVVESLFHAHPDLIVPAYGVHPWKAHLAEPGWEERLRELLVKAPSAAIGECGVDRWIESPDMDDQAPIFEAQLRLARELDRPVVIHCLKAWQPLFDSFERIGAPQRFVMHSFNGSLEIARRLLPMGAYFSFSGYFLQPRKAALLETYLQLPPERVLMETDAPDMLPPEEFITHPLPHEMNHPANLPAIVAGFAARAGLPVEEVARRSSLAFEAFYGHALRATA